MANTNNKLNNSVEVTNGKREDWRQNPWSSRFDALEAITGIQRIYGQRIPCKVGEVYVDHWFVGGLENKHFVVADNTIGQEDALIYAGTTFDDVAGTVTLDSSKWRISDVPYTLQTPVTYEIPEAHATLLRQDIVVGDYNGQVSYITGTAGVTAVQPTIPYKNILITSFIVSAADGITEVPETPEQDGTLLWGDTDPTPTTGKTGDSFWNKATGEVFAKELVDGVSTWVSKYIIAPSRFGVSGEDDTSDTNRMMTLGSHDLYILAGDPEYVDSMGDLYVGAGQTSMTVSSDATIDTSQLNVKALGSSDPEVFIKAQRLSDSRHIGVTHNSAYVAYSGAQKEIVTSVNGEVADANGNVKIVEAYSFAVSDETTALTVGTAKISFRMPYAFTLSSVRASLNEAPAGSNFIVNIKDSGTTIFSTNLTIDSGELTSTTAATPAVLSDTALADDALITVDIVQVGSTTAGKGLKISFIGTKS